MSSLALCLVGRLFFRRRDPAEPRVESIETIIAHPLGFIVSCVSVALLARVEWLFANDNFTERAVFVMLR